MALAVKITRRAQREMMAAAMWWADNRLAAPGAIHHDVEAALLLRAKDPGVGVRIALPRTDATRRLFLPRVRYYLYYRVKGETLQVVSLWHASRGSGPFAGA